MADIASNQRNWANQCEQNEKLEIINIVGDRQLKYLFNGSNVVSVVWILYFLFCTIKSIKIIVTTGTMSQIAQSQIYHLSFERIHYQVEMFRWQDWGQIVPTPSSPLQRFLLIIPPLQMIEKRGWNGALYFHCQYMFHIYRNGK